MKSTKSLKSQIVLCQKAQWVMTGLMLMVLVLFFAFGFRPGQQKMRDLTGDIDLRTKQLETKQSRAFALPYLAKDVAEIDAKLQKFNKKLPKSEELGDFLRTMTQVGEQCAIRKPVFTPGILRRMDLYNDRTITVDFAGEFSGVYSFLRQMEEMPRLTRLKSVKITTRDAKLGMVDVNMAMNIYYSEQ